MTGLTLLALWFAEIASAFETAMIYAALGQLIKAFGDPVKAAWLVTIYLLVGAGAAAIIARLGDIYGRRRMLLIVLVILGAASLLSALASSFLLIVAGRAVQGLSAAVLPLCFALARENFRPQRLPIAVGVIMSGASGGIAIGLVLGGYIVDRFGWQAVFYASFVFAALAWVMVRFLVPRSPENRGSIASLDIGSALLFVPGVVALLLALSNGKDWGWTSPLVLSLLAGGCGLLALWIRRSLTISEPLIDVRLFRDPRVAIANLSYALIAAGGLQVTMFFAILLQSPRWTGVGLGVSAAVAGLVKLPSNVLAFGAGPLSGFLMTRLSGRLVMGGGGLLASLGWLLAMFFHGSIWQVGASICIISVGTTILFAAGSNIVVAAVPPERTGEAGGVLAVIRALVTAAGAQLVAVLLASSTVSQPGTSGAYPDTRAFFLTLAVITAFTLASSIVALMLPGERGRGAIAGGRSVERPAR